MCKNAVECICDDSGVEEDGILYKDSGILCICQSTLVTNGCFIQIQKREETTYPLGEKEIQGKQQGVENWSLPIGNEQNDFLERVYRLL